MLLTASDLQMRMHYLNARQTLRRLLDWRVVPVVNENDTTATDEITFGDNDFLAAQVAIMLEARLLVLLTDIAGLHTRRPAPATPAPSWSPRSATRAELAGYEIGEHTSPLGLGGMRSKTAAAEMAGAAGIPAVICDGTAEGTLLAAAAGEEVGTRFHPHRERDLQLQALAPLREAEPRHDRRRRRRRAGPARDAAAACCPVGITEVEGEFEAGDAVEVAANGDGDRQGHRQLLRRASCAGSRGCAPTRSASCSRTPPRRPCTATTSCSPERGRARWVRVESLPRE